MTELTSLGSQSSSEKMEHFLQWHAEFRLDDPDELAAEEDVAASSTAAAAASSSAAELALRIRRPPKAAESAEPPDMRGDLHLSPLKSEERDCRNFMSQISRFFLSD